MWVPGSIALCVSVGIVTFMKDTPESAGYPPVDQDVDTDTSKDLESGKGKAKDGMCKTLMDKVLRNPGIWCLALTYFFVCVPSNNATALVLAHTTFAARTRFA